MALPTPEGVLNQSGLPDCLGVSIDLLPEFGDSVFGLGLKPLIEATIGACLGPIDVILKALPKFSNPIKFTKSLLDISPDKLPNLLIKLFNDKLGKFPSFNLGEAGISAPFNVKIGTNTDIKLDPLQIKFLGKFILSLLKIPLEIFKKLVEMLLSLDLSFNIPDLIKKSLSGFPLIIDPEFSINLPAKFAECMTKVLTNTFAPLTGGGAIESAQKDREKTIVEQSKKALNSHEDGDNKEALDIIEEYHIKPEEYKNATGYAAFFRLKDTKEFKAELI